MQKLLLISLLLLVGCTKIEHRNNDYSKYVDIIFESPTNYVNVKYRGYKYYLPKGIIIKETNDNNIIFSSEETNLYLYVDVVSNYYDKNICFSNNDDFDYKKKINESSYLIVDENRQIYFIRLCSNHSIMEFYAKKEEVPILLTQASIVLNSIEFNRNIIQADLDYNSSKFNKEKLYEIGDLKKNINSFSKYLNSYIEEKSEDSKLPE